MTDKNALVPDIEVRALDGQRVRLWDFRQKTHLLLLVGANAATAMAALDARKKIMDWLNLRAIACAEFPDGFTEGAHLIDRYGRYVTVFPLDETLSDRVEKELVYYEARHC